MKDYNNNEPTLLVWRGTGSFDGHKEFDNVHSGKLIKTSAIWSQNIITPEAYGGLEEQCPFCSNKYVELKQQTLSSFSPCKIEKYVEWGYIDDQNKFSGKCSVCGFWHNTLIEYINQEDRLTSFLMSEVFVTRSKFSVIKQLGINDSDLAFDELSTYLSKNYNSIYYLTPKRFEQLVASIYINQGYKIILTKQSRDGGHDIILLGSNGNKMAIVECKRYAEKNKVNVSTVRSILGVGLIEKVSDVRIVTSSYFTKPAHRIQDKLKEENSSIQLSLMDADDLIKELGVFTTDLPNPSLSKLKRFT